MSLCRLLFLSTLALAIVPAVSLAQLDTVFVRHYDGGQADEDLVSDMALDSAGNFYLCGAATTGSEHYDIVVLKYSQQGDSLWAVVYQGSGQSEDSAAALAVDAEGNVYVCGWSTESDSGTEMLTMRIDADGRVAWAETFGGGDWDDAALDLCVCEDGRVVVTGFTSDSTRLNYDYCTIAYDADSGETLWVRTYNRTPENEEDVSVAICEGPEGSVCVTGYSYDGGTEYDIVTIKYAADGNREWLRRYNNRPWVEDDYGVAVAYNATADGFVVGGTVYDDNHEFDYFTMMYSLDGDSLWARAYNRYPANDEDILMSLAVDQDGNTYVTGTSLDEITDFDIATVKYSSSGVQQWVSRYDLDSLEDGGVHLSVGTDGDVYVAGCAGTQTPDWDLCLLRLDGDDGSTQWAYSYDNPVALIEDCGCRVFRRGDSIYAVGHIFRNASNMDFILMMLTEIRKDYAVLVVVAPESLYIHDSLAPQVVVQNRAMFADSCWLRLTVSPSDYSESTWVSLGAGEVDTVQFPQWHPTELGPTALVSWTALLDDETPGNDTSQAVVMVWDDTSGLASGERTADGRFDLAIAPNPARTFVSLGVWLPPDGAAEIRLYDAAGSKLGLLSRDPVSSSSPGGAAIRLSLDVREIPAGVYFLKLCQADRELTRKFVVQK